MTDTIIILVNNTLNFSFLFRLKSGRAGLLGPNTAGVARLGLNVIFRVAFGSSESVSDEFGEDCGRKSDGVRRVAESSAIL